MEECGPELYFKNLTQATFSPEINKEIWNNARKGLELENHPEFQISGDTTEEDFENPIDRSYTPCIYFCQAIEKKSNRESEYSDLQY